MMMELTPLNYPTVYQCKICNAGLMVKVEYYRTDFAGKLLGCDEVPALYFRDPGQSNLATMEGAEQVRIISLFCPNCYIKYEQRDQ